MKRFSLTVFAMTFAGLYLGCSAAYAQHPHPGGPGGMGGSMSAMHSSSGMHGNSMGSTASSKMMASTNPGGVLDHNTNLATKLEGLLGLSGPTALDTLKTNASGFRNFGQFVAAVHVSHNLGIPFSDLQQKMTGSNPISLGKAIQELKPTANSGSEVKKALKQAHEDTAHSS